MYLTAYSEKYTVQLQRNNGWKQDESIGKDLKEVFTPLNIMDH